MLRQAYPNASPSAPSRPYLRIPTSQPFFITLLEETAEIGDEETSIEIPQFLWLLEKKSSSSGIENDSRDVSVWVLIATEEVEGSGGKVQVTYKEGV